MAATSRSLLAALFLFAIVLTFFRTLTRAPYTYRSTCFLLSRKIRAAYFIRKTDVVCVPALRECGLSLRDKL